MSVSPGQRFGSYEIVAIIGAGGMGEVFRARDTELKREVALKLLPQLFLQDAERLGAQPWIYDLRSDSEPRRLTFGQTAFWPMWSSDGSRVAARLRVRNAQISIVEIDTAGFAIRSAIEFDVLLRVAARGRDRGEGASR
jgi:serine/threonine protein kinase